MMHSLRLIVLVVLTTAVLLYSNDSQNFPDIQVIQSDAQIVIFDWHVNDFQLLPVEIQNQVYSIPVYPFGATQSEPGAPYLPWRTLIIGIPEGGHISVQIIDQQIQTYPSIRLAPVPTPFTDNTGMSGEAYITHTERFAADEVHPQESIRLGEPTKFRDMHIQEIHICPLRYDPAGQILTFNPRLRVQVTFHHTRAGVKRTFEKRGLLDEIYEKKILNFNQAQQWQTPRQRSALAKVRGLPAGPYYRVAVTEDGIYKITGSTLQSAGIQLSNVNLGAIQMFNNGGRSLNFDVTASRYNPDYTNEIPILIVDQNQNGQFDSNDYILFYGKGVNGWFFDPLTRDFAYHQHPYAKENHYLLTFQGANGKRITTTSLSDQPGASEISYFYDRYHFEEDRYNLLASGPDWYGYRFFGRSDSYARTFNLTTNNQSGSNPFLRIRLKGGSGIKYSDDLNYRYTFNIALNNQILINNVIFYRSGEWLRELNIPDPNTIINGQNTLSFQYSGNLDACTAYLDWFEIFYPRNFSATNNFLNFYTNGISAAQRYRITNLGVGNDFYVLDVSNPVEPVILRERVSSQNGALVFDLPALSEHKNLIVTSLSSPAIKEVTTLSSYSTKQDLISTNNSADFLIVTHQTFVPYARKIAELRRHLKSMVVTMEDVYFNFNSSVPDPTALRNFIRYAYNNWQGPAPSYVLLFGDGHYDYRNISLPDTQRVPPFQIYDNGEVDSRTTDNYYVDLNYRGNASFRSIVPNLAIGRLPMESTQDAERMVEKLIEYENNPIRDGWQVNLGFVADDEVTTRSASEWIHQSQTESLARLSSLSKFLIQKVYLSAYPSQPGGFGRIKPQANNALIDLLNQGVLIINYVGHGSPTQWAHESVFNMNRDLERINNPGKLPFLIAATCDFGKYDDPASPSFTETLIWKKNSGVIGVLAATRLVYSGENFRFNRDFYSQLFPGGSASIPLGMAKLLATQSSVNDQKYHLFADPTMRLADPKSSIRLSSVSPDTLKALSQVNVHAEILTNSQPDLSFNGGAVVIVNDARYDSVTTGGGLYYTLPGPTLFKGEVTVEEGRINGRFIVPKSIRYQDKKSGRITLYAWSDDNRFSALGFDNSLLFVGSTNIIDDTGPAIDIYFKGQENFSSGDLVAQNPVLIARISDENGINMTGESGHNLSLQVDNQPPRDISAFFFYDKNSFQNGYVNYPLDRLKPGEHTLKLTAFDNLNNITEEQVMFRIADSDGLILMNVVNYPNPFRPRSENTRFTFEYQTGGTDAQVEIKIYTITGRLIQKLDDFFISGTGYHEIPWDGRDRDGDEIANGVYLYKLTLKNGTEKKEVIEKLVILN